MHILLGNEAQEAKAFFIEAGSTALQATCHRAKCGSVIVSNGQVIGRGYNSPPLDREDARMCGAQWVRLRKPKSDVTCCVHAEWRAILDALKTAPGQIGGSRLYFMRLDANGSLSRAGEPYCTVCSRLAMEAGVEEFALWQEQGMTVWSTEEYNQASYSFFKPKNKQP